MKIITIIILISIISCSSSIVIVKGDRNKVDHRQRIDSIQLQKNDFKPPLRWMK